MSTEEYYDLAWRAARKGLGELDYMLAPLGLRPDELEDLCARSRGVASVSELNVALRFSCAVVALAASLSSQLSSMIVEAAMAPDLCGALSSIPPIVKDLSSSLIRDLKEEGAVYRVADDRLFEAAMKMVRVVDDEARLLGSLCGHTPPEKL